MYFNLALNELLNCDNEFMGLKIYVVFSQLIFGGTKNRYRGDRKVDQIDVLMSLNSANFEVLLGNSTL